MRQFRFHVVALPHTQTSDAHQACAYTQKVLHFCEMMTSLGHEVLHYGAEGSEVAHCSAEHVEIISAAEQNQYFGPWDRNKLYQLGWSGDEPYWPLTNGRAAEAIAERKQPRDFLCLIAGRLHEPIAHAHPDLQSVEYGIGYYGTFAQYRVFESYAHMHHVLGRQSGGADVDGRNYDVVIPNYFDPADYPFQARKGDYFLYLGRLIKRKGVRIAVETCKALGAKLILAGQGCRQADRGRIIAEDGEVYEGDLEYAGCVVGQERGELFGGAKAVFTPTTYIEPFGGVAVEAQMAGTPVIASDWVHFTETIEHGRTGYRCRTLDQFVWAARHISDLDPWYIHSRAVANWSLDRVKWMYQEYFEMLSDLWNDGWYAIHENRKDLNWLAKC